MDDDIIDIIIESNELDDESDEDAEALLVAHQQLMSMALIAYQPEPREVQERRWTDRHRRQFSDVLMRDYFTDGGTYSDENFRTRYRMRRELFLRILHEVVNVNPYFTQRFDARGIPGHTPHQKLTGAFRILTHGVPADLEDEYLRMGKSTAYRNLKVFCDTMVRHFGPRYLRTPTADDVRRLMDENASRGFPGMLGSLDCMHWIWKNCPVAWHGQFQGHAKGPTVILEAVASYDMWIWHAFFGTPGSCNDLNVLYRSPLFDDHLAGRSPPCVYTLNGTRYESGYYLADGIYPTWANIVKSFQVADTPKKLLFNEQHQAKRKDVERAFALLKGKFAIVAGPVKYWDPQDLDKIMKTCIILSNMIVEDERRDPNWTHVVDENVEVEHGIGLHNHWERRAALVNAERHTKLRNDLVEHIWARHGSGTRIR